MERTTCKPPARALALLAAAAVALMLAFAAPPQAHAGVVASDDPATALTGDTIYTVDLSNRTITAGANVGHKTNDNGSSYYYMKKGKTTATMVVTFKQAGVTKAGQVVDYVMNLSWKATGGGASGGIAKNGVIYEYANKSGSKNTVLFAADDINRDAFRHGGADVEVTLRILKTGTSEAVGGYNKLRYSDLDQPHHYSYQEPIKDSKGKITGYKTKWGKNYTGAYTEGVELRANYGGTWTIGTSVGSGHEQLKSEKMNNNPWIHATHPCSGGNRCSLLCVNAADNYQVTLRGDMGAGSGTGLVKTTLHYDVIFNGNGATGGSTASPEGFGYNETKALNKNGFVRTGYVFKGWNTDPHGNGNSFSDQQRVCNLRTEPNGKVTLYAQWEPIRYNVIFNGNGHTGGSTESPEQFSYDETKNLNINGFVRTNYTFMGWNTDPNGRGTAFRDQQRVANLTATNGATLTLYAQWMATSSVELYVDGSLMKPAYNYTFWNADPNPIWSVPAADTLAARKPDCHKLDGSQGLEAWYTDPECQNPYTPAPLPLGGTLRLYARNIATVSFANGPSSDPETEYWSSVGRGDITAATGTPQAFEKPYGKVALLAEPRSMRAKYDRGGRFDATLVAEAGWHLDPTCADAAFKTMTVTRDATVYKKWMATTVDGIAATGS